MSEVTADDLRWNEFLLHLEDDDERSAATEWMESRPAALQPLVKRYPPGTTAIIDQKTAFLMGYDEYEDDTFGFIFTFVNPGLDYDGAIASKFSIHADHENVMEFCRNIFQV